MSTALTVKIGSRKSQLAVIQAEIVEAHLRKCGLMTEKILLTSPADEDLKRPLYEMAKKGPGVFTKQLEEALLNHQIDVAVHSLKDVTTLEVSGLKILGVTAREDEKDILLIHPEAYDPLKPLKLKVGAAVGTSSLRREAQLLLEREDLKVTCIRGNLLTRIEKLKERKVDALCLARAGIERLKMDLSSYCIVDLPFIPAPGQGALAIQTRVEVPSPLSSAIRSLACSKTEQEVSIERAILRALDGGCSLPLGVLCRKHPDTWKLNAFLGIKNEGKWRGYVYQAESIQPELLVREAVEYFKSFDGVSGRR